MKSYKLSSKQLSIIFIQVALFAILWIAPKLIEPYIIDSKIMTSGFYTMLTFIYWLILLAIVVLWERKSPSKPLTEQSELVVIPMWRRMLVIVLIPLTICLGIYFQ
jgi:hypothetical protein